MVYLHRPQCLGAGGLRARGLSRGQCVGPQQPAALLVVVLVHTDEKSHALAACSAPQGVCEEHSFERLQQSSTQVVCPEGLQVVQLCELDVTHDGAQVPGSQHRVGLAEQLKLPLQRLTLV